MAKVLSRSLIVLVAAMALAIMPLFAWAADTTVDVSFYKDENTVAVELQNPVDIDEDVNALQLTLSMNVTEGSMDGITPGFVFNTAYNASVKQARYNSSVDDLTIYVAGAGQNLLPEKTNLVLGWLVFNTVDSASATFDVDVDEESLSMVGSMRNPLTGEALPNANATARVTINGSTVTVDANDRPKPSPGNNNGGNNGGNGDVGGNPVSPLPPNGYNPTTDTPEQYNGASDPSQASDLATPNLDNLDPSASESADESVTSTSNVSPSVARAQRENNSATAEEPAGLPVAAIIGILVAVVVVAGLVCYFLYRRSKQA